MADHTDFAPDVVCASCKVVWGEHNLYKCPNGETKFVPEPDRIAQLERDLAQAVQMYTDAAGERDKALADLAAAQAERDALRERANALLHQIDIGDYVDSEGHALKNNIAVLTLMKALTNV